MKIKILVIGKTGTPFVKEGFSVYEQRLKHYAPVQYQELPDIKQQGQSAEWIKQREGELIIKNLKPEDLLYLLDERGDTFSSREFAQFIQKKMNAGTKSLVLCIGGAFGFSEEVYKRALGKISLSALTFPHELVRLFLVEQLYRAFTILRGEHYHHD